MSKIWLFRLAGTRSTRSKLTSFLLAMMVVAASHAPVLGANLSVYWDAPDNALESEVVKYRVYRAYTPVGPYSLLKTVTSTQTTIEVPTGETRCVRIKAVNSLNEASLNSHYFCYTIATEVGP